MTGLVKSRRVAAVLGAAIAVATDMPTYGAWTWTTLTCPGATWAEPRGISGNNIVGVYTSDNGNSYHGFLYDGATWTTLDHPEATRGTRLEGIDGNKIVGSYSTDTTACGFLYDGTTWTTLLPPGAVWSNATAVDGNRIVGRVNHQGFRYDGATWTTFAYPGATFTAAEDISDNNIVGWYSVDGDVPFPGFLYDGTTYTSLDCPAATQMTMPTGIDGNNIVGSYSTDTTDYGFLYDGTTWTTLLPPGAVWSNATAVDGNRIVGRYVDSEDVRVMYLLTIPEPASLLLLALGGLTVMRRRERVEAHTEGATR